MIGLPLTLAWYAFLLCILWAFQRLTRWSSSLNIFSIFLSFLILRHGITVPFDHNVNQWYAGIDVSRAAYVRFYTSLVLMWGCLLAGAWLGRIYNGSIYVDNVEFRRSVNTQGLAAGANGFFLMALIFGVVLVMVFNLKIDGSVVKLLTGKMSSEEYRAMRDTYGTDTHYSAGLGFRLASIVRFGFYPMFVATLYFLSRRDWFWRALFLFTLFLGLSIGVISGQKGASIFLLVTLAIAVYYGSGRLRLRLASWRVIGLACFGVLAVVFLYRLQYPEQSFEWALHATTYRLTSESDRSLQLYFEIYPDIRPFLYGHSSGLINLLTHTRIPVDQLPERFIPTYYLGPNYLNTWNAAFIGDAWADFGYVGVVLESIFVGWLLFVYARWFARARKTALVLGTQVGLMMASTRLSEVALTANLLTFGLLSSFLLYLVSRTSRERSNIGTCHDIDYAHSSSRS